MILLPIFLRIIEIVRRKLCTWCHQCTSPPIKLCAHVHCLFSCYYFSYYWWKINIHLCTDHTFYWAAAELQQLLFLSYTSSFYLPTASFSIKACSYFSLLKTTKIKKNIAFTFFVVVGLLPALISLQLNFSNESPILSLIPMLSF